MMYVYGLSDPNEIGMFRYVGVTKTPQKRLKAHISQSRENKTEKDCWIQELVANGKQPTMTILQTVTNDEDGFHYEAIWIDSLRKLGHPLFNALEPFWSYGSRKGRPRLPDDIRREKELERKRRWWQKHRASQRQIVDGHKEEIEGIS